MKCAISEKQTGVILSKSKFKVEPGFFVTPSFTKRFGDWRNVTLPPLRVYKDGSPRIIEKKHNLFYYDKKNILTPIINEPFHTLPLEIRSGAVRDVVNTVVYQLLQKKLLNNEDFLAGEAVEDFNINDFYDEITADFEMEGASQQILDSVKESKDEYLEAIMGKLRNVGMIVTSDAVRQPASIERPTTDKASAVIKAMMQLVPQTTTDGEWISSPHLPASPLFVEDSKVWGVILQHLADLPYQQGKNTIELYMDKLEQLSVTYPWVNDLIESLDEGDSYLKVQFVTAVTNIKNNINNTFVEENGLVNKNASNAKTSSQYVTNEWSTILTTNNSKLTTDQKDNIIDGALSNIEDGIEEIAKGVDEENIGDKLIEIHDSLAPFFETLGIGIEEPVTVTAFAEFMKDRNKDNNENIDYVDAFKIYTTSLPDRIAAVRNAYTGDGTQIQGVVAKSLEFYAKAVSSIDSDGGQHMASVGKNRVYIYSLPSVLQQTINEWKANPQIIDSLLADPTLKNSIWLQKLKEEGNLNDLVVGFRGVVISKDANGQEIAKKASEMSKGDYAKIDFYNIVRLLGSNNKHIPIYNTQVPADKGKEFQLTMPNVYKETDSARQAAKDYFFPYIQDEFTKMKRAENDISDAIGKEVSQSQIKFIVDHFANKPDLVSNAKHLSELVVSTENKEDSVILSDFIEQASSGLRIIYHISPWNGLINMDRSSDTFGKFMGGAFKFHTVASVGKVDNVLSPITGLPMPPNADMLVQDMALYEGILEKAVLAVEDKVTNYERVASNEFGIKPAYIKTEEELSKIMPAENMPKQTVDYYKKKYNNDEILATKAILRDYVINSMISKVEYAKLFTGTLNHFKSDGDYIKRVPATYIDGLMLVTGLEEGDETFTQMTFATESLNLPRYDSQAEYDKAVINDPSKIDLSYDKSLMPEVRSYYSNIDRTDAQAYISPQRWKRILKGTGKFGPNQKVIYNKIMKQGEYVSNNQDWPEQYNLTKEEVKILSAQPVKGVFNHNDIGTSPVYLKYSQAVLLPQFVNNNPRARQLYEYMQTHGIDEMVADTGIKVGAIKPKMLFDSNGNFVAPAAPELLTLNNSGWRLQQDLPTKTIKDTKVGVQVQKIIMSSLVFNGDSGLRSKIENALGDLSNAGLSRLRRKYGLSKEGSHSVEDIDLFYESLIKDISSKEVPEDNLLRALGAHVPISAMPMLEESLINNIFSTVRKSSSNLLTLGGAYIQVSDQLIGNTEIEKRGIKMITPTDRLLPPRVEYRKNSEGEVRKVVSGGQVLVPHTLMIKYVPNYQSLNPSQLQEAIPQEFREMIGYRIPTQAKASVSPLEVVGILPPELGDSIITYGEITAQTGSDFDIDKMFFMVPTFEMKEGLKAVSTATNSTTNIYSGTNENAELSNFAERPFLYEGVMYHSVEQAFQYAKQDYFNVGAIDPADTTTTPESLRKKVDAHFKTILDTTKGSTLKSLGRRRIGVEFEGYSWDQDSPKLMKELILASFEQNPEALATLAATGISKLTHTQDRSKWGRLFPKALMEVRKELGVKEKRLQKVNYGEGKLQNNLFDLFYEALTKETYYNEMMTSIDNDTFKEGTLSMLEEVEQKDMDIWDPVKAIQLRFDYLAGGLGVADSANSLSDHIVIQGKEVKIRMDQGSWGNTFMDAEKSETLNPAELTKLIQVLNGYRNKKGKKGISQEEAVNIYSSIKIGNTLSELTNAFVDLANEQAYITRGNWGAMMNGYGMMMIRQGVHPHKVSAMLLQPAMREMTKEIGLTEGQITNTSSKDTLDNLIDKWISLAVAKKYNVGSILEGSGVGDLTLSDLDFDSLMDSATTGIATDNESVLNQIRMLMHYKKTKSVVKKYNAYVTAAKTDAKGAGKNIRDMFLRSNRFSDAYFSEPGQLGIDDAYLKFFDAQGNPTVQYTVYENTIGFINKLMTDNPLLFNGINSDVLASFNTISAENTDNKYISSEANANFMFNHFKAYRLSGFTPLSSMDVKTKVEKVEQPEFNSIEDVLVWEEQQKYAKDNPKITEGTFEDYINQISELKKEGGNSFINALFIDDSGEEGVKLIMNRASNKSPNAKNELTDSWRMLFKSNPKLADFLVRQSYQQSNFLPGPQQFHSLIPFEWFLENEFVSYLQSAGNLRPDDAFINQAIRNKDAGQFFKGLFNTTAPTVNGNIYILAPLNNARGKIKSPKYGLVNKNPYKLVGVVTKGKGKEKVSSAVYVKLNTPLKNESAYDTNHGEFMMRVDPESSEANRLSSWKEDFKKEGGYITYEVTDKGKFFAEGGRILNLSNEREQLISSQDNTTTNTICNGAM